MREVLMKYLSVCSGIEAATVAWHPLGWRAVAYSEIEPFPSAVLAHHYPDVPNLGDMTKYKEWDSERIGAVDVLVGGTPCQSFSVAGLRKGLEDPRGNLMLTFLGIADRYRPRYIVWENVPGVLSSNGGKDFGSFLGALGELGYGWAYRVLDAQWFGVAQRRRRVFVVGCLGDQRRAAEVLFESESVSRNTPPRREQGKRVAACLGASAASSSSPNVGNGQGTVVEVCGTLTARSVTSLGAPEVDGGMYMPVAFAQNTRDEVRLQNGDGQIVGALSAGQGTKQTSYIAQRMPDKDNFGAVIQPTVGALCARDYKGVGSQYVSEGKLITENIAQPLPFDTTQLTSPSNYSSPKPGDPCHPLAAGAHIPAVAFAQNQFAMAVRRLTPVECERLQGFPDNHTNIPWRKKAEAPDGPRYKALGNSMAVPVMRWIGKRIAEETSND